MFSSRSQAAMVQYGLGSSKALGFSILISQYFIELIALGFRV